jgi:hypothetical protein
VRYSGVFTRLLLRHAPVINEDIYLELLELMELYCELLIARFGMLDQKLVDFFSDHWVR